MRHIKFLIGRLEIVGGKTALVGGRCCGDEIRKGDRTTVMIKNDSGGAGGQEILRRELTVIFHTLQAYGRDIDVISPGMTASLIIPDTLAEEMHLNWVLEGRVD